MNYRDYILRNYNPGIYNHDIHMKNNNRALSDTPVGQRPTLRQGDSGEWVAELQRELTQLTFYDGPIDGVFGAGTANAVKSFQTNNKLTADGVVGRGTWSALIFLYAPLAICPNSGLMPVPFKGIVIDAGHGGSDPGAIGNGIIEKELTLMISIYMNDRFYELNIPHAMTRTTDETLTPTERVNRAKSAFGADPGVILISNHINAGGGEGAEVIYALRNTAVYPTMILNEIKLAGQLTRRVYQKTSPDNSSLDYYYIIRDTSPTQAVIVEYGFLDNVADANRLKNNWRRYAEAVIIATCAYIGVEYRPPYSNEIVYTVVAGDSLWSIAQRFQTTVNAIMTINNLTSSTLRVGQQLLIPFFETVPPVTPPTPTRPTLRYGDRGEYVVELQTLLASLGFNPGTIDGIFGQGTLNAVIEFQTANGLTADGIVGPTTWNAILASKPEETFTHTVVAGDSLWSIAQRFGTTVAEIKRINNLTSDVLNIGQQLQIPLVPGTQPPEETFTHTVVAGDSLWSIAQRFGTTVAEIKRINNLTSDVLNIGQQLQIPL